MNVTYVITGVFVLAIVIGGLWLLDVLAPGSVMVAAPLRMFLVFWGLLNGLGALVVGLKLPDPWYLTSLMAALILPLPAAVAEGLFLRSRRKALASLLVAGESLPPGVRSDLVERWAKRHGMRQADVS